MYLRALGIAGVVVRFSVLPADWTVFIGTLARLSASSGMLYNDPSEKKKQCKQNPMKKFNFEKINIEINIEISAR